MLPVEPLKHENIDWGLRPSGGFPSAIAGEASGITQSGKDAIAEHDLYRR